MNKHTNTTYFNSFQFDSVQFGSVQFSSLQFNSVQVDSVQLSSVQFNCLFVGTQLILIGHFQLGEIRGSAGFGVRYRSPVGPIRVDLGFKLDRREFAGAREPLTALHFSIGQAF